MNEINYELNAGNKNESDIDIWWEYLVDAIVSSSSKTLFQHAGLTNISWF